MNKTLKIICFGFLIWLIPFLVSVIIFPLKSSMNPLFESIMPLIITLTAVIFCYFYFKGVKEKFQKGRHTYRCCLVCHKHSDRSSLIFTIQSHADEFHQLYPGYWFKLI